MTDTHHSPELQEVDPDLMRRVAWGLLANRTKAAIAAAEGIGLEECRAYCTTPGMFAAMNVWANVLERRHYCGTATVKGLVDWAIDFMVENAAERLDRSAWWRVDQLVGPFMQYCFGLVVGWFIRYMDGVLGWRGAKRKHFCSWRQSYIDQICWAVEIAIQQQMLCQQGEEYLTAADEIFREAIADKEIFELGISDELGVREALAGANPVAVEIPTAEAAAPDHEAEPDSAVAEESEAPRDHAAPHESWMAGSRLTMTTENEAVSDPTWSWPAPEPAIQRYESRIPDLGTVPTRPHLVHAIHDVEPVERPPVVRNLLYESVRFKRRRCSSPLLVRHLPVERAA